MNKEVMNQELIKCPCCEKMVPANDIELTFRRPDVIAEMDSDEIDERCKYNNDIYILDDSYYYLRCVLPLPVQEKGENYNLGVWVQLSEHDFSIVWELWDEEDQSNQEPMKGLLVNKIPLTKGSFESDVLVQLTGTTSRPKVIVQDTNCSLFKEQQSGISIHRASEYSDLCR